MNMPLDKFDPSKVLVGFNQSRKHIQKGLKGKVFLASDVSPNIAQHIRTLCALHRVEVDSSYTMVQLGRACGIEVACGVCVLLP